MQNPTQPMRQLHVCFSGSLTCSGCRPCTACHEVIVRMVLIRAMMAAGFNGSREQANAFFAMHAQAFIDLHIAMDQNPEIASQKQTADIDMLIANLEELARFRARDAKVAQDAIQNAPPYAPGVPGALGASPQPTVAAFGDFSNYGSPYGVPLGTSGDPQPPWMNPQNQMQPGFQFTVPIAPTPAVQPEPVQPSQQPQPISQQPAPTGVFPQQFPQQPILTVEHLPPRVEAPAPLPIQPPLVERPAQPASAPNVVRITSRDVAEERVKHLTTPMSSAELAASIAPANTKPNGVVIGDVMTVPPELRSHLPEGEPR